MTFLAPKPRPRAYAIAGLLVLLGVAAIPLLGGDGQRSDHGGSEPRGSETSTTLRGSTPRPAATPRSSAPRIEDQVLKTTWPVVPNQDARAIAKGLAVLASSYASELPEVTGMQATLEFILATGELYHGGFVAVSLASMRTNPMYAESVEDNLVMQIHPLLAQKDRFESGN